MGCGNSKPSQFEGDTHIKTSNKPQKPAAVPKLNLDITALKRQETRLRNKIEIATFSDEENLVTSRKKDDSRYTQKLKENLE